MRVRRRRLSDGRRRRWHFFNSPKMRMWYWVGLACGLCHSWMCPAPAWAEEDASSQKTVTITGRVFNDAYVSTRPLSRGEVQQASSSLWMDVHATSTDRDVGARAVGFVNGFETALNSGSRGAGRSSQVGLREAFVEVNRSGLGMRLGQQIIPWGKSDVVNPTDVLTAKDFAFLNPDEEVRRLGAISLWTSYSLPAAPAWNLQLVWTPVFPQSNALVPTDVLDSSFSLTSPQRVTARWATSEWAGKLSYQGESIDVAAVAFAGWDHYPYFDAQAGAVPSTSLAQSFQRWHALGLEASLSPGASSKWILRAESAFTWTQYTPSTNGFTSPPHADAVIGAERPIGDDFRLQLQAIARWHSQFAPADSLGSASVGAGTPAILLTNAALARTNALLHGFQDRWRTSGTLRLSYAPDGGAISGGGATELEWFTFCNFTGWDFLLRPKVLHKFSEMLHASLGWQGYYGPNSRPFGALKSYSAVFAEGKVLF